MTPVEFTFITPTGVKLANAEVEIQLAKTDYSPDLVGVVMPRQILTSTDEFGKLTVSLWPSNTLYSLLIYDTESDAAISYNFYVPVLSEGNTSVQFQDIVVDAAMSETPYDEAALLAIHNAKANTLLARDDAVQAKIASLDSEQASQASQDASLVSENNAKLSELASLASKNLANASQVAANSSETQAGLSEGVANAKALEAGTSATSALNSKNAAALSESNADTSAGTATTQANAAGTSATAASDSAILAGQKAVIASDKAAEAEASAIASAASADQFTENFARMATSLLRTQNVVAEHHAFN